jgi:hypothetical protein
MNISYGFGKSVDEIEMDLCRVYTNGDVSAGVELSLDFAWRGDAIHKRRGNL